MSSRQLKRQLKRANGGRGPTASSARSPRSRSREERLNRILLIGGSGLAIGAVLVALLGRRDLGSLIINLVAIGLGLLMGKGIGRFMFRRVLPAAHK
jgi:hypothetical protein